MVPETNWIFINLTGVTLNFHLGKIILKQLALFCPVARQNQTKVILGLYFFLLMNLIPEDLTLHSLPLVLIHQEDPEKDRSRKMFTNI